MADKTKFMIFFFVYCNVFIAASDLILQIIYYATTEFINSTIKNTLLAFILMYPSVNIIMVTIYLFSHNDFSISVKTKIKYFFMYLISSEFAFSIGVHKTFKSRYSLEAENIIVTTRVLNTLHLIFVSLPQLLIVTVHSSSLGEYKVVDILSLLFSSLFFFWSILYYVFCCLKELEIELELEEYIN
jgi:hypothetical protein